jgi:hypothetical protein
MPSDTDTPKIPNACNVCHMDKLTEWAIAALKAGPVPLAHGAVTVEDVLFQSGGAAPALPAR